PSPPCAMISPSRCPLRPRDCPGQTCRRPDERPGSYTTPRDTTLTLPWSSGQAEGRIDRLKPPKRQMYGRASLDLLRRRTLLAA
ncbi:hypothetical protein GAY28_31390, partial [Azospirillum brasilense]|nr:hypothetical protein [Azospirillum brasilense]